MKYKAKLIATLMTMCLVFSFAVIGILAVKTLNMSVGGNISFSADGVSFTVGNGVFYESNKTTEYTGITSQSGKLQGFAMNTNTKLADVQDEIATWAGLELNLDSRGDSVLKFNIKNDMSDKQIYVTFAVTLGTNTNNNMNIVAPTTEEIYPTENKNIEITFDILDMNINAGLTGFKIDITISDTAANPGSTESNPIDSTELPNLTFDTATASDGCISVAGNGATGDVVIPAYIKIGIQTYKVTEIPDYAFQGTNITSMTIPNTVRRIGKWAFSNCKNLKEIVIPSSVTKICEGAFSGAGLESVVIENGVEEIQSYAFAGTKISTIKIPASVKYITAWGAFENCANLAIVYSDCTPTVLLGSQGSCILNYTEYVYFHKDITISDSRFTKVGQEGDYNKYTETITQSMSGGGAD